MERLSNYFFSSHPHHHQMPPVVLPFSSSLVIPATTMPHLWTVTSGVAGRAGGGDRGDAGPGGGAARAHQPGARERAEHARPGKPLPSPEHTEMEEGLEPRSAPRFLAPASLDPVLNGDLPTHPSRHCRSRTLSTPPPVQPVSHHPPLFDACGGGGWGCALAVAGHNSVGVCRRAPRS